MENLIGIFYIKFRYFLSSPCYDMYLYINICNLLTIRTFKYFMHLKNRITHFTPPGLLLPKDKQLKTINVSIWRIILVTPVNEVY